MDSVRFGRALGMGARQAAKALVTAADAAASPNPSAKPAGAGAAGPTATGQAGTGQRAGQRTAEAAAQVKQTGKAVARGGRLFGGAVWAPFVKLSGVLWLELTGVFFGLFVLTAGLNAWKLRGNLHETGANHTAHQHLLFSVVMMAVFGYFSVSSFVRAGRKGRRGR